MAKKKHGLRKFSSRRATTVRHCSLTESVCMYRRICASCVRVPSGREVLLDAFADVQGQFFAKRALEIAAAGAA